jgi:hypothetical protein
MRTDKLMDQLSEINGRSIGFLTYPEKFGLRTVILAERFNSRSTVPEHSQEFEVNFVKSLAFFFC